MPKLFRVLAVLCAMVLFAAPASAGVDPVTGEWTPDYVESPVYLHCTGDTKVGNLHSIADGMTVSWDANKPTASYQSGAGCGTADTALTGTSDHNPIYDFTVAGFYTGNIDTVTLRLWAIEGIGRAFDEFTVELHVKIDGEDVITRETPANAVPIASSTGAARLYEVTITGVDLSSQLDSTAEHEVVATVYPIFADGTGGGVAWVYDAAEIDSGLVFNDTTPAAKTVARNSPRSTTP